jgi:hypothetical protein
MAAKGADIIAVDLAAQIDSVPYPRPALPHTRTRSRLMYGWPPRRPGCAGNHKPAGAGDCLEQFLRHAEVLLQRDRQWRQPRRRLNRHPHRAYLEHLLRDTPDRIRDMGRQGGLDPCFHCLIRQRGWDQVDSRQDLLDRENKVLRHLVRLLPWSPALRFPDGVARSGTSRPRPSYRAVTEPSSCDPYARTCA